MKRFINENKFMIFFVSMVVFVTLFLMQSTGDTQVETLQEVKKEVSSVVQVDRLTKEELDKDVSKEEVVIEEKVPEVVTPAPVVVEEVTVPETKIEGNSIEIPGVISLPLMKDENGNHFYLNHNLEGVEDGIGVPYIDYRTDFLTRKMIVYSHSSTSGNGPFNPLQNYHLNSNFYSLHPFIKIHYDGVDYTYQIFSVYVSVADSEESEGLEYFHQMYYSHSSWDERVKWYKNHSEYDTGVEVSGDDKILILQTCSMDANYYKKYYRYNLLVMGKMI